VQCNTPKLGHNEIMSKSITS
nr:hypothetical protein [Tanacetum cinerariifolium]